MSHIQVIKTEKNVLSVIKDLTKSESREDAFYICNINDIINIYKKWKSMMPRVEPFYAVKCNDSKIVLEVLAALGANFDCASKEEIRKVLAMDVAPSRIIFANPAKKINHVKFAAASGVSMMTFDNENELDKVKMYYPDARMVLRIRYDDPSASYILGNKYGCDHKTEASRLLCVAKSLGINVIGVSFHIGSFSKDNSIYAKAIEAARYVFDISQSLGYNFNLLDIGGGFPGGACRRFFEISKTINRALNVFFPDPSIRIISEPGRYFVHSVFTLASTIHSMKEEVEINAFSGKEIKFNMYYLDVSIYGGLISTLLGDYYPFKPLIANMSNDTYPSIIWGATCDGADKIAHNVMLPKMNIGDWMVCEEAGAYTLSTASEFNGFSAPDVVCILNEDNCYIGWKSQCTAVLEKTSKQSKYAL